MRYFILDGTVSSDALYKTSIFDLAGQNVTVTNNDATAYRNVCQTKKFFTEPYDPQNNYFQYKDFNELDILKHLKATMPKQVIGVMHDGYNGALSEGVNDLYTSLRKLEQLIVDGKLLIYGGQAQIAFNQESNRGYFIKGEISVSYRNPPIILQSYALTSRGMDYHYGCGDGSGTGGGTSTGQIFDVVITPPVPDAGVTLRFDMDLGNANDARTYFRSVTGYNGKAAVSCKIHGGVTKLANDNNDDYYKGNVVNGKIVGESNIVYTTYIRLPLTGFVPNQHVYCMTSPNPFYNVFSKDGTLIKSEKMPVVKINNFDHIVSPSYMSKAVNNSNTAILIGGYISKISHCRFSEKDFPLGTSEVSNLLEHNSFLLNNGLDSGDVWINTVKKINILPDKITLQDIKFTGEHVLVSGTTYHGKETIEVPFLDSQLSDIIYTCNNSDYTMKIVGRMPKPLLGSGLFPVSTDSTLVIGGITTCPNSIEEWKNVDGTKDVYNVSIKDGVSTVTKVIDTKYIHMFPALYKLTNDTVLIISGEHFEVYKNGVGTIQDGDLKFGARYGSYIHKFMVNGISQFCICGGWKYTVAPYYPNTGVISDSFGSLIEKRTTYNGDIKYGYDTNAYSARTYMFINIDRDRIYGSEIIDSLDTDKDPLKAVYYQIDFNDNILVYNYSVRNGIEVTLSYELCASADKINWSKLDEKTDILFTENSKYAFELKNDTKFRYYRLYLYKVKKTESTWQSPRIGIEFGTDYFKCKVPVHYVGQADIKDSSGTLVQSNQIENEGWWRPNLDFENFEPTQDSLSAYKNATPSIEWNNKVETISDIFTNEYSPEFIATKYVVMSGDDIVLKIDNLVTQYKSKICYTNQNGTQVEVDINSTSYTLSSNLLQTGLNKIYLYVVKNDSLTYLQCAEFFVNTPVSLTCSNAHPTVGSYIKLNSSFDYGIGTITPGNIHVEPNSSIRIDITSLDTIKYTLTVDLNGIIQTADITITPSLPVNSPIFTINELTIKSIRDKQQPKPN